MSWYEGHSHKASWTDVEGNWMISNDWCPSFIKIKDLLDLCNESNLKTIDLKDIAWKGKHLHPWKTGDNCYCCGSVLYHKCDPSYPGIVAYNAPNPYDNKYRMLDGRHRIMKLLDQGHTKGSYYVLDWNLVKPLAIKGDARLHFLQEELDKIKEERKQYPPR